MRSILLATLLGASPLVAQADVGTPELEAALAGIAESNATGACRGELFDRLAAAPFAQLGRGLARRLVQHPYESGIAWRTETPWLELPLADADRIAATFEVLWQAHTRPPRDAAVTNQLFDLLAEPGIDPVRERILPLLLVPGAPIEEPACRGETIARLERLVQNDPSPRFRAVVVRTLSTELAAECFADLAIEIARTQRTPDAQIDLLLQTGICAHADRLAPGPRQRQLQFVLDLLQSSRADVAAGGFPQALLAHASDRLFLGPGNAYRRLGNDAAAWLALAEQVLAWRKRHEVRDAAATTAATDVLPRMDWRTVLACRVQGECTLSCRSSWHAFQELPLTTSARLALTAIELGPFLPAAPIQVGAHWTVQAAQLRALASALADVPWQGAANDPLVWWTWRGEPAFDRVVETTGSIDVSCERRDGGLGLAIAGTITVEEQARIGSRYGPNELRATAQHQLRAWLPLDEHGAVHGCELHDEVEREGRYGSGAVTEPFVQRATFATLGAYESTEEESRAAAAAIASLHNGEALPECHVAAGQQLRLLGRGVAERLVTAIATCQDPAARLRLAAALRRLP